MNPKQSRRPPDRPDVRRAERGASLVRESTKAGPSSPTGCKFRLDQYTGFAAVRQEGRGDIQKFLTNFRAWSTPTGRGRTAPGAGREGQTP